MVGTFLSKAAYLGIQWTETEINDAHYGSSLVTFYNKKWEWDFVHTVRQSLTNDRCGEIISAVGKRRPL